MATDIFNAVVTLATVIKKVAEDAHANVEICQSLASRVEMVPRILRKFPDGRDLDEELLGRLFQALKQAHDLIISYKTKSRVVRVLQSSYFKTEFGDIEAKIGILLDDLNLCISISSAAKIEAIRTEVMPTTESTETSKIEEPSFNLDYNDIEFESKRGIRTEAGTGSFARAYLANLKSIGAVVVKEPLSPYLNDHDWIFAVKTACRAHHRNICRSFGGGVEFSDTHSNPPELCRQQFIVMEYLSGGSLFSLVQAESKLLATVDDVLRVGLGIVAGLHHLHSFSHRSDPTSGEKPWGPIVHGALSPKHIMFDAHMEPKIIDICFRQRFEATTITSTSSSSSLSTPSSTASSTFSFSPAHLKALTETEIEWKAPEQVKAGGIATTASDVFSCGLVLAYLVSGQAPYGAGVSGFAALEAMRGGAVPQLPSPSSARSTSLLQDMMAMCVSPVGASRPSSLVLWRSLARACSERGVPVPNNSDMDELVAKPSNASSSMSSSSKVGGFEFTGGNGKSTAAVMSTSSSTGAGDAASGGDDDGDGCGALMDFDDMAGQMETFHSSIRIFVSLPELDDAVRGQGQGQGGGEGGAPPPPPPSAEGTCVVLYGDKVVMQNYIKAKSGGEISPAPGKGREQVGSEGDEGEADGGLGVQFGAPGGHVGSGRRGDQGTVIFHIDNTTSMKAERRLVLTKEVLHRVVPTILRQGFRVIINAWSTNSTTNGKVRSHELEVPDALLESDSAHELHDHLERAGFHILVPDGRTDLYGSCFQLLNQCQELVSSGPVHAFVLTDGQHNLLGKPLHAPTVAHQKYFDYYESVEAANGPKNSKELNGFKWKRTAVTEFSEEKTQLFLKGQLDDIRRAGTGSSTEALGREAHVGMTLIGIGDAETACLAAFASRLGDGCSFYGITQVDQADEVFSNVSVRSANIRITASGSALSPGGGDAVTIAYSRGDTHMKSLPSGSVEQVECVSGCAVVSITATLQALHTSSVLHIERMEQATAMRLWSPPAASSSTAVGAKGEPLSYSEGIALQRAKDAEVMALKFMSALRRIRAVPYEVTASSFVSVFRQLLNDKRLLQSLKASFFSKSTRALRAFAVLSAVGVWIREIEDLIDAQIASYRMNVENELLVGLSAAAEGDADSTTSGKFVQPSQVALERLQNNLRNTGAAVHKVTRHVAAISSIRDRTLVLTTRLLSSRMTLSRIADGIQLVTSKGSSSTFGIDKVVTWTAAMASSSTSSSSSSTETSPSSCLQTPGSARQAEVVSRIVSSVETTSSGGVDMSSESLLFGDVMAPPPRGSKSALAEAEAEADVDTDIPLAFPCILLRGHFDSFCIIRAPQTCTTIDIIREKCRDDVIVVENEYITGSHKLNVFCMQEIWELCNSSSHSPGNPLPVVLTKTAGGPTSTPSTPRGSPRDPRPPEEDAEAVARAPPNMVLPLAHTPLLFALYADRGRAFHSGINVTGDCMALTPVAFQWGKFFHDAALELSTDIDHGITVPSPEAVAHTAAAAVAGGVLSSDKVLWAEQGIRAVVSFSYAIEHNVAAWAAGKSYIPTLFGIQEVLPKPRSEAGGHGVGEMEGAEVEVVEGSAAVISRDAVSGITCALGLAALVACDAPFTRAPIAWNRLMVTIYSRMAEAISGTKIVRFGPSTSTNTSSSSKSSTGSSGATTGSAERDKNDGSSVAAGGGGGDGEPVVPVSGDVSRPVRDPGELENEYRLHLGALQVLLRRRLHVEWAASSLADKVAVVRENAAEVLACLRRVALFFFARFVDYRMTTWTEMVGAVRRALVLKRYDLETIKRQLIHFEDMSEVVQNFIEGRSLNGSFSGTHDLVLPVFEKLGSARFPTMRDLVESDHVEIAMYIDALVATKASPKVEYKPVVQPSYPCMDTSTNRSLTFGLNIREWDTSLPIANVAFVGNVNSGKSSLSGKLLSVFGAVPTHILERLGREAEKLGHPEHLKHAWVMDRIKEERGGGFTIVPTWAAFQTPSRRFTLVDNPGHKDFSRNSTFGIFHADTIVLVMSAVMSEVELAEGQGPQGRSQAEEHLLTAMCFGAKQIVVAVNKMDAVSYAQTAFDEVKAHTTKKLSRAGFKDNQFVFVPVSVLDGEGIAALSSRMEWYQGPCLMQLLDESPIPARRMDKPFRMVISDVHKVSGIGSVVCGTVLRGSVAVGDKILFSPSTLPEATVKSIEANGCIPLERASAGDDVGIAFSFQGSSVARKAASKQANFRRGMVLSIATGPPAPAILRFEAQIFVVRGTFKASQRPTLSTHLDTFSATLTKLVELIGRNNVVLEREPTEAKVGQTCVCQFTAERPFAAESIHEMPRLSRFLIKHNRQVAAIGFIRLKLD